MNPKISVVIPAYNSELFIQKAIHSVLVQEYPAHEIIVVDDGSVDDTPKILASYGARLRTVRIQNSGASNARNVGMRLVTGDYIAFLDHDDIWFKAKLEKQADLIKKFPEIGLICCNYVLRTKDFGNRLIQHYSQLQFLDEINFGEPLRVNLFELLVKENFPGTPSAVVVKKRLCDAVGYFSDAHRPAEDYEYWLRCAAQTNAIVMKDALFYKRTHGANLSNDRPRMFATLKKVRLDIMDREAVYIRQNNLAWIAHKALAGHCYEAGNFFFENGKPRTAFWWYWGGLNSHWTSENLIKFLFIMFKKVLRMLTFDLFRKKTPLVPLRKVRL
jgi:glycosyltransferase involved in cell wall biosynthesis